MRDYQLGIYEKAMPNDTTWLEKLTAAKNAGFDFVEISVDESDARQARLDWTQEERMMLVNTMKVTGMPIR